MAEALRHWEQSRNLRKRQCDCLTKSDTAMKKLKKFVLSSSCLSLDENAMYRIDGLMTEVSGKLLMNVGLLMPRVGDYESWTWCIEKQN